MQLNEHESKALAAEAGVPIPEGRVVSSVLDAVQAARDLAYPVMIKAQIPAGRRGKAGGVLQAVTDEEVEKAAARLLGGELLGHQVSCLLVERRVEAQQGAYVGISVDPAQRSAVLLLSGRGGVDVEEHPGGVGSVPVAAATGMRAWHVWRAASFAAGLAPEVVGALQPIARAAYRLFVEQRAKAVELNPVLIRPVGAPVAVDVRVVPEGGTEYRAHRSSVAARRLGFDIVVLDPRGHVGMISTGAGGSMMLADLLTGAGLRPIDFCDIRTGGMHGDPARLLCAFDELARFPGLRCIAVNVFAGITDIVDFARCLAAAVEQQPPPAPLIVRVEGANSAQARGLLTARGLRCVTSLDELLRETAAVVRADAGEAPA